MTPKTNKDDFTLVEHLTELRVRIVYSLIAVAITTILAWNFSELIFDIVRRPILPYLPEGGLVFTAPMDKFMAHLSSNFGSLSRRASTVRKKSTVSTLSPLALRFFWRESLLSIS